MSAKSNDRGIPPFFSIHSNCVDRCSFWVVDSAVKKTKIIPLFDNGVDL